MNDIGLIGLGTMGGNLARNIANHAFNIGVYNRTAAKTSEFVEKYNHPHLYPFYELKEFVRSLERPRKVIVMVDAGKAVDAVISELTPLLNKGDLIIDCGNSYFKDTQRRSAQLTEQGMHFLGCGVSGGAEGALKGPSMMPGGSIESWHLVKPIFTEIAARDFNDQPCITYIADNGAGHYVKMVHNGIEYGIMQLMAEAYDLLKNAYGLDAPHIADIFEQYNRGILNSYLFEISTHVLRQGDDQSPSYLVDKILDTAAQKGTGKWTSLDALERGVAIPTITEAVNMRFISARKKQRVALQQMYSKAYGKPDNDLHDIIEPLEQTLYLSIISCYAQGFDLIQQAAEEEKWNIDLAEIARIWEGGCIIRAKLLAEIEQSYRDSHQENAFLLAIPSIEAKVKSGLPHLRSVVHIMTASGVNGLCTAVSQGYIDTVTSKILPANFLQGLRDYFGAHTYQRTDMDGTFHTEWNTGAGD